MSVERNALLGYRLLGESFVEDLGDFDQDCFDIMEQLAAIGLGFSEVPELI